MLEIQSLEKKILEHRDRIAQEDQRAQFLQDQKSEAQEKLTILETQLKTLKREVVQNENLLSEVEKDASQLKNQLLHFTDHEKLQRAEKNLNSFQEKIEATENFLLQQFDQLECLEKQVQEKKAFLQGLEETLEEISIEIQETQRSEQNSIDQYHQRVTTLLKQCSPEFEMTYKMAKKKHSQINFFSFLSQSKCQCCLFLLDKAQENEIELQYKPHTCPSCSRFLIPLFIAQK